MCRVGSSPLTRGKLDSQVQTLQTLRLIPAHAGKTRTRTSSTSVSRAHPRSRGENASELSEGLTPTGSSPLTRGKQVCRLTQSARVRLIPAHAGKTGTPRGLPPPEGAHPRSRGENVARRSVIVSLTGSSPLTRGKPSCPSSQRFPWWLIPAHAGKTVGTNHGGTGTTGSSPLTRGKPPGKPGDHHSCVAHPRSRGENQNERRNERYTGGSSPLTRGKREMPRSPDRTDRLIPAHAGKTAGQRLR